MCGCEYINLTCWRVTHKPLQPGVAMRLNFGFWVLRNCWVGLSWRAPKRSSSFVLPFSLHAAWNADVKTEIPAAFLGNGVPLFSREQTVLEETSKSDLLHSWREAWDWDWAWYRLPCTEVNSWCCYIVLLETEESRLWEMYFNECNYLGWINEKLSYFYRHLQHFSFS